MNDKIDYDDLDLKILYKKEPYQILKIILMQERAIKFIEDYGSMVLEARRLAKEQEGTGLKILTPNQMRKRLPIALAQVKAGNNSESLLNEIRQIVCSF